MSWGSGGVPPGGSGAPGWQIPGARGLLGRSEGRPCQFFSKTGQNIHFWHFWGCGGYPPGGSGAPGWQNPGTRGLLGRSEGRPCQFSPKTGQKHTFLAFGGVGGTPRRPQAGRIQGPGASCAGPTGATPPIFSTQNTLFWQLWGSGGYPQGVWGPSLADSRDPKPSGLSVPSPRTFWAGPRPTCPVSCPETRKVVLCRLSSNPYRVREAKCLLGALTSRRAAGTGREDPQPDKRGVWGVNPKP